MNAPVTFQELAELMHARAGLNVDPREMEDRQDAPFTDFELDSLGLLGIVAELEKRYGCDIEQAEGCSTPRDFLAHVNSAVATAV